MKNALIYEHLIYEDEVSKVVDKLHFKPYLFSLNSAGKNFKAGPLSLVSNRAVIGLTGSFDIHYLNMTFHLQRGDYLFLPETSLIYFESCEEENSIVSIDYESEKYGQDDLISYSLENEAIFIKNLIKEDYYFEQFRKIDFAIKEKICGSYILAKTALEKIKMMAIDYRFNHGENSLAYKDKVSKKEEVCRICMKYIDEHISSAITIQELAEYCNYSPNYIYKSFSECLLCSTQHYILIRRLYMAIKELRLTNNSIEIIANNVGFSSVYHFSNAFKKEFGISPSQYRKKQQLQ